MTIYNYILCPSDPSMGQQATSRHKFRSNMGSSRQTRKPLKTELCRHVWWVKHIQVKPVVTAMCYSPHCCVICREESRHCLVPVPVGLLWWTCGDSCLAVVSDTVQDGTLCCDYPLHCNEHSQQSFDSPWSSPWSNHKWQRTRLGWLSSIASV